MTAPSYGRIANARDYTSSEVREGRGEGGGTKEGVCHHKNLRRTKTRRFRSIFHYIMPTQSAVKSHTKASDKIPAKKLYTGQFKKTSTQKGTEIRIRFQYL
jgi:hypothetical protein